MTRAPDPLQPAGDRGRGFDLHDEVDGAHVDAELERAGRDQRAQMSGFQQILDFDALCARERAVMRAHQRLTRKLVERRPRGAPPACGC